MRCFSLLWLMPLVAASAQTPQMPPAGSPIPLGGLSRSHRPEPTTAGITVADLMTRAYIIGDDSMQGRETGLAGGVKGTDYIAAEAKRLGLKPAGDNGSFFQTVPFTLHRPDSSSVLQVGERSFLAMSDFLIVPRLGLSAFIGGLPYGGSFEGTGVPTVWGGRIGDGGMIDPAATRGKVVVFGLSRTTQVTWQFWRSGETLQRYFGAKAVIVDIGGASLPAAGGLRAELLYYNDVTLRALPVVIATSALSAELFGGDAATIEPGRAGRALSGRFGYLDRPTEAPTRNVVAILPGSDPQLRAEYVAVGAHSDHVGFFPQGPVDHDSIRVFNSVARPRGADDPQPRNVTPEQWQRITQMLDSIRKIRPTRLDSIMNGADDDGSGTVLALEIAEAYALAKVKPKRSLLFVWHAAEEKGLYGAEFFADHPTVPRDSIVAQINMDQMGRGGPEDVPPGGPNSLVVLGTRRLSRELGAVADLVNQRPDYRFRFDTTFDAPRDPSQGWCRSDHYMYARYSIPVLFFVSAVWYIDYHMVSDEPQYLNYPRMAKVGNYIRDVVGAVANLPHRPTLDHGRLDPEAVCQQ
ncbi:MAG: M28 family peptidase [Gemmatimonadales bacterium]